MPTSINKANNFRDQDFYIGLDVHSKSWTVTVRTMGFELAHFTQQPDASQLARYLKTRYSGNRFLSAYEAGFCGTSAHYALRQSGIENIIVHAADLPQTDKQKKNKTDMHDSRAIARYLEKGLLKSIYIMPVGQQETRALYRCREAKVRDVTRCTNRVRSLLYYFGVQLPDQFKDKEYISKVFLKYLSSIELTTIHGTLTLQHYTCDLIYHRAQLLDVTRKLRKAILAEYGPSYYSILTVPGIGPITAMALLAETGSLERFRDPDDFVSYLGLIPAERSSGETLYTTRIQPRCNTHLRPILIEAAWGAIRKCPVMLAYFKRHAGISGKKSIVKVARKLVLIAKAVALHQTTYQPNYFEQKKVL